MATIKPTLEVLTTTVKALASRSKTGAAIVSVINDFQAKRMKEHFDELCTNLEKEIKFLENTVNSHYEHPEYNDNIREYIYSVIDKIIKERTETKRNAYRHVLLNSTLTKMSDYDLDLSEKVIKIIEQLTRTEIIVLYNLKDITFLDNHLDGTETKNTIESVIKKSKLTKDEFVSIAKSLEQNYLVEHLSARCGDNGGFLQQITKRRKFLTDLGETMVNYILIDGKLNLL